jgi:hypothetical protein
MIQNLTNPPFEGTLLFLPFFEPKEMCKNKLKKYNKLSHFILITIFLAN